MQASGSGAKPISPEFGDWQIAFEASGHPLSGCLGKYISASALRDADQRCAAQQKGAAYVYSRSTYGFLAEATAFGRPDANFEKSGYLRIVDLDALLCTLCSKVADGSLQHGIDLISTPFNRRPALDPVPMPNVPNETEELLEQAALDHGAIEALALASLLATEGEPGSAGVDLGPFVFALIATLGKYATDLDRSLDPSLDANQLRQVTYLRDAIGKDFEGETLDRCQAYATWVETSADWRATTVFQALDYNSDGPITKADEDLLGFYDEARAAAELVCLKNSGALALGVFGDWGSGKSSFLRLMENEIGNLCRAVRTTKEAAPDVKSPFFENAECVRFSVWEYNDSQLLLSLANRTFDCLNNKQVEDEITQELKGALQSWRKDGSDVQSALKQAEGKKKAAIRELEAANSEARQAEETATLSAFSAFALALGGRGKDEGQAKELAQDVLGQVEAGSKNISTVTLLTDLRFLAGASKKVWLSVIALGIAVFALVFFLTSGGQPVLALLSALVTAGLPLLALAQKLVSIAAGYARDLTQAEKKRETARRAAEIKQAEADQEIAQRQRELGAVEAKLLRFGGGSRDQRYDFFLSESSLLQQLSAEAGLTSRVRRAFEILNDMIRNKSDERADEDQTKAAHAKLPDKIVFFIDELDRCRAEQVVRMLEAIHLLLAFENFAVVVAVDSRWLEGALLSVFEKELQAADRRGQVVHEYIEKIIQVPIRVRGLTFRDGDQNAPGGSYVDLIQALTPIAAQAAAPSGGGGGGNAGGDGAVAPLDIEPVLVPKADARAAAERAVLTQGEVSELERMGRIVGTSPRTVKRFVNVYRLIRAVQTGPAFEDFVTGGPDRAEPLYRPVILCLAIQCGLTDAQAETFREAVKAGAGAFTSFLETWSDPADRAVVQRCLDRGMIGGAARLRLALDRVERYAFWTEAG